MKKFILTLLIGLTFMSFSLVSCSQNSATPWYVGTYIGESNSDLSLVFNKSSFTSPNSSIALKYKDTTIIENIRYSTSIFEYTDSRFIIKVTTEQPATDINFYVGIVKINNDYYYISASDHCVMASDLDDEEYNFYLKQGYIVGLTKDTSEKYLAKRKTRSDIELIISEYINNPEESEDSKLIKN